MKLKAKEIKKNKKGVRIALCETSVWIEKENYMRGKMVKQWAYIVKDVSPEEALNVFNRRTK